MSSRVADVAQAIWMKTMTIKTFAPVRGPSPVRQQDDRSAYKRSDRNRGRCGYRSSRDGNSSAKPDRRHPWVDAMCPSNAFETKASHSTSVSGVSESLYRPQQTTPLPGWLSRCEFKTPTASAL